MRMRVVGTLVLAASLACGNRDTAARDDPGLPGQTEALWFRQARALDLTGDGTEDSAVVEARGHRSDSLRLRVAFLVGGKDLFAQDWSSSYQLANLDSLSQRPPRSDEHMRAALTQVLQAIRLTPLDTSFIRDFPGDTAALRLARRGPVQSIIVAYGYETTIVVVWDPDARRFLVAHACC